MRGEIRAYLRHILKTHGLLSKIVEIKLYNNLVAINFDAIGPKNSTKTNLDNCIDMTKPAFTVVAAAMTAIESAPPGLDAK